MPVMKSITVGNGATATFHKIASIETQGQNLYLIVNSWLTEADYLAGGNPVWQQRYTFPFTADLMDQFLDTLMTTEEFSGATIVQDNSDSLDTKQAKKWAEVKTYRDNAEYGLVEYGGHAFDADKDAQRRITGGVAAVALARLQWLEQVVEALATELQVEIPEKPQIANEWTTADDEVVSFDVEGLMGLGMVVAQKVSAAHKKARGVRSLISAATEETLGDIVLWPADTPQS